MDKNFHNCDGHCAYCDKQVKKKCPVNRNYNDSMFAYCLMGFMLLLLLFVLAPSETYADTINLDNDLVQIDYVEIDSSTQLILPLPYTFNTNSSSDSLSFTFDGNLKNNSWQVAPFGSYNNSTDRGIFILVNPSTGKYSIQYGNSWSEGTSSSLGGSRHSFVTNFAYGSQSLIVDGVNYASFTYKPSSSYSINQVSLFQRDLTGSATTVCDLRGTIYSVMIRQNGNIIYNLTPCYRRSTDSLGLYDSLSHRFYEVNKGAFLYDGVIPPLGGSDIPSVPNKPGSLVPINPGNPNIDNSPVMQGLFFMIGDIWHQLGTLTIPIINLSYTTILLGLFVLSLAIPFIHKLLDSHKGGE